MPTFEYSARDELGQVQTGVVDAASATIVVAQLRDRGWIVINVGEESAADRRPQRRLWSRLLGPRNVQVELSFRQLAVMLRGGISLLSGMQTIATQSDSRAVQACYEELIYEVEQGRSLSDALESMSAFPEFAVRLTRVGERTGVLETVLVRAADMMRSRRQTVREILTALTYPVIVIVAAGGATIYMVTTLIPKLTALLEGLGKPLPPITQSLVDISDFALAWGATVGFASLFAAICFIAVYLTRGGRLFFDRLALRIPIVGRIFQLSGTLTFSQTLGGLLQSGVPMLDALVTVQQMHSNEYFASLVQRARDAIIRGNNLADALRVRNAFMPLLATMTAVGEESGNLDEVLAEVTEFHQSRLSSLIQTLSAWITPAIIVLVGGVVGYVYIAFFLGMFAIAS